MARSGARTHLDDASRFEEVSPYHPRRRNRMKADTFAKLLVLDTLVEAEIGHYLAHRPASPDTYREELAARVGGVIDEIDVLDSVVAGRAYDAIVDFLAELPEDQEGMIESATTFRRALDRIVERGIDRHDLAVASTWAIVLEELLRTMAAEYRAAVSADGDIQPRGYARAAALLDRARGAADRMLWTAEEDRVAIREGMDTLTYAVRYRRLDADAVDTLGRLVLRRAARYRPSTITRVGAFVLRQLIGRDPSRRAAAVRKDRAKRTRTRERPKPRRSA